MTDKQVQYICITAPFVIGVACLGLWILQANANIAAKELAKHETCYKEYRLDERSGETYLIVDYCGKIEQ